MAHRIGIFHQGRLIRCGTMEELRKESTTSATLEDFFLQVTADDETPEAVR
jgi:ABC-type multidrug transport system ATPase subunit